MVAFGGAGPIHAYELARRLGTKEVLFPQGAGVASAVGMLVAPRTVERTQSMVARTRDLDWAAVHGAVARLESEGRELLVETGASHEELRYEVTAEMRYAGQGSEVEVPLSKALLSEDEAAEQMESQFAAVYRNRYGRSLDGFPTEVLSWRVRAMAPPVVSHARLSPNEAEVQEQEDRWRDVYFLENNGFLAARVLRRNSLTMNSVIQGPAVVEEDESTIVIGPGAYATVDSNRNLVMTLTS
jgi:N-methylhydantoinase A